MGSRGANHAGCLRAGCAVRAGRAVMQRDSKLQQVHWRWRNRVLQHGGMEVLGRCGKCVGGYRDTTCCSGNTERGT
eukprot:10573624-Prorocentrum_lima.AAC.1